MTLVFPSVVSVSRHGALGLFVGVVAHLSVFVQYTHASTGSTPVTLPAYLDQVKSGHAGLKGSLMAAKGGELRSDEGTRLLAPTFFASFKLISDAKLQPVNLISYDSMMVGSMSFGVSQQTSYGLMAKLHYDMYTQNYLNPSSLFSIPGVGSLPFSYSYANAAPVLELTQSLWSNGFGRTTQAVQDQLQAQALASSYASRFQAKVDLAQAETTYWRLSVARQTVSIQNEAIDRAKKIYEWNARRARLHLGDQGDVLQADALVKLRQLDLLTAQNEERSVSRSFNSLRNIDSDEVKEQLVEVDPEMIEAIQPPHRVAVRDDVKAADQSAKASIAGSEIAIDKNRPSLDLFASAALNGQQGTSAYATLASSIPASFTLNRPTYSIGLQFSTPLDFGVGSRSKDGWKLEHVAAELNYDRKLFEQEQSWKDLNESLQETKQRFSLSRKLESTQQAKLINERDRLSHGRTTTYQVLLFEQDYLQAQLIRIKGQMDALTLISQMKLFGESL